MRGCTAGTLYVAISLVADVNSVEMRLDWLDRVKKIQVGRKLQLQFQKVESLKVKAKNAELYLHRAQILLKQAEEKPSKMQQDKSITTSNVKTKIL